MCELTAFTRVRVKLEKKESFREPAEEKLEAKNGDAESSFSLGAVKEKNPEASNKIC